MQYDSGKKRIAFIRASSIYNDSRATKEISALLESGYEIELFGWNRDGRAENECKKLFPALSTHMHYFNSQAENGIGGKNSYKLLLWMFWVAKQLRKYADDVEIIHACDFDAGYPSCLFAKRKKIKFVYDIFDYYVDAHSVPKHLRGLITKLENSLVNESNLTIICTEDRYKQITGTNPRKVTVIHNSPEITENGEETRDKNRFDYVYCGSLCEKRLIGEILEEYKFNSDLKFCFAGYGEYSKVAKELDSKYENFTYIGSVSYKEVLEIESQSCVLSAIYDPEIRNHRLCAPNKFYEAMALCKPIIVIHGTGIDRIVDDYGFGISIGYSSNEFYEALRKLTKDVELSNKMGEKGRSMYVEKYDWKIMKKRLMNEYERLLNKQ